MGDLERMKAELLAQLEGDFKISPEESESEGEEGEESQGEEEDHGSTHVRRENMAGGNTRNTHGTTGACLRRYGRARARARRATFRLPATLAQPSRVRKAVPATLALRTYVPV